MLSALLGAALPTAFAATSNEQAAQQIANNLKESGQLKGYRVGVKYEDGVAWLVGHRHQPAAIADCRADCPQHGWCRPCDLQAGSGCT